MKLKVTTYWSIFLGLNSHSSVKT